MTGCLNPAVRWCLVLAVAWAGAVGAPAWAQAADVVASPPDESTTDQPGSAAPPDTTVTGLPKDLGLLTRDELIDLVKDLTLQNQILAVRLAEQRKDLANAAPDLQTRIDWQARTIDRLQAKLKRAEQQQALVAVTPPQPDTLAEPTPAGEVDAEGAAMVEGSPPADPATPDANPEWKYRFAYEFGLIRTSGDGHVILRDEHGKRQRHEFDYTEYRRDALWVNLLIRNDSAQPMRFAGLIELQGDKTFLQGTRERFATHAFRTPLLQPGEVFQLSESELLVDRPWKVDVIELTNVQGFSTPADPDPDPGSR